MCPGVGRATTPGTISCGVVDEHDPAGVEQLGERRLLVARHPELVRRVVDHEVLVIALADVHDRVRERDPGVLGREPAVVVEVQVRDRDHVDVRRLHAEDGELVEQRAARQSLGGERADAGVDQQRLLAGHEERAHRELGVAVLVFEGHLEARDVHEAFGHREDAVGEPEHAAVSDAELAPPPCAPKPPRRRAYAALSRTDPDAISRARSVLGRGAPCSTRSSVPPVSTSR